MKTFWRLFLACAICFLPFILLEVVRWIEYYNMNLTIPRRKP